MRERRKRTHVPVGISSKVTTVPLEFMLHMTGIPRSLITEGDGNG